VDEEDAEEEEEAADDVERVADVAAADAVGEAALVMLLLVVANRLVQYLAVPSNALRSALYCWATCASCGSSALGHDNSACKDRSAVRMVSAGDHSVFRMSRHIAPVADDMLGCQIFVSNFILGGTNG